jgi:1-aminocyclopropane-1-carboxylate deaminase/D-cysteine desulfhydrase-like pyridoxal-dependent ACC family enzyme
MSGGLSTVFDHLDRQHLATLPTPLERGPQLDGGARLWIKRDDLTGLGGGGNKVRKLEFLCGAARAAGAGALVTVGAAQSNHCRMTAAAGAVLGLEVHLIVSGERPETPTGNQLLSALFGAHLHYTGLDDTHWGALEIAREELVEQLRADGVAPYSIGIGGSSAVGAVGYAVAYGELIDDCLRLGIEPTAIVHTSSSGGTHAGLLAGQALHRAAVNESSGLASKVPVPAVIAIGVAKGVIAMAPDPGLLADEVLDLVGESSVRVDPADVIIDPDWIGPDYAVPTPAGDAAILWAARHGGWLMDRTYSGKGLSAVLGRTWPAEAQIIFIHTGGTPALFAPDGTPLP